MSTEKKYQENRNYRGIELFLLNLMVEINKEKKKTLRINYSMVQQLSILGHLLSAYTGLDEFLVL